jgi:hypothetical protein
MSVNSNIWIGLILFVAPAISPAYAQTANDWSRIVAWSKDATVLLRVEVAGQNPGYGSGFVVTKDGLTLTARHVLPPQEILDSKNYLISGLLGWDKLPIDFNHSKPLNVTYVSSYRDLALLQVDGLPSDIRPLCGTDKIRQGEPLMLLAYPGGGVLTTTAGIASGPAPDDLYRHDAGSGTGQSGGPLFDNSGAVLGLQLAGTRRTTDGDLQLGYFLLTSAIVKDLAAKGYKSILDDCPKPETRPTAALPQQINFNYLVNLTKSDHEGIQPTTRSYESVFPALSGYRITSARFIATSINHAVKGPDTSIIDDGSAVSLAIALESGPLFDQWRGWVSGNIVTQQRLRQ